MTARGVPVELVAVDRVGSDVSLESVGCLEHQHASSGEMEGSGGAQSQETCTTMAALPRAGRCGELALGDTVVPPGRIDPSSRRRVVGPKSSERRE